MGVGGSRWPCAVKSFPHRSLRPTPDFEAQRKSLVPDDRTWDEVCQGFDATIAADPTVGEQVGESPYWLITTERATAWNLPRLRLLYAFDDRFVDLLAVGFAE